jgi:hypothetical protein
LLYDLKQYRPQPLRETFEAAPGKIPSSERVVYVNATHAGNGDGRSRATAYASLQAALDDAGNDVYEGPVGHMNVPFGRLNF